MNIFAYIEKFNDRFKNSTAFWWTLGLANSISTGLYAGTHRWLPMLGTLAMMGWSMYELTRIRNLKRGNKNVK